MSKAMKTHSGAAAPFRPRAGSALAIAIAMLQATAVYALPQEADFNAVNGDSTYGVSGSEGTLTITNDNRVVEFDGQGVNLANGETLNVTHSGGNSNWSVLVRDVNNSSNASNIDGLLNADVKVFLVNANGIVFGPNATVNLNSLVASTLDAPNFGSGDYTFSETGTNAGIEVQGLQVLQNGAQIALISHNIEVDGTVSVPAGELAMLAGNEVVVTMGGNNQLQFDITQALASATADGSIRVTANGELLAGNVELRGWLNDPLSNVVNNQGLVRASGIDLSTPGEIHLVGRGATVVSSGTLDVSEASGDGTITTSAGAVQFAGDIEGGAGDMQVTIGHDTAFGRFEIVEGSAVELGSIDIQGQGDVNIISGLGNYTVSGLNSGTAAYFGVGGNSWDNTGAISFSGVGNLFASSAIDNIITIEAGGELLESFGTNDFGIIQGGGLDDTIRIAGTVQRANGAAGDDVFELIGSGVVVQEINGGENFDTIISAIDPVRTNGQGLPDPDGINGSAGNIASWTNIQVVEPRVDPPTPPVVTDPTDPTPPTIVPQQPVVPLVDPTAVTLGLVSDDANLRLPCGFGGRERDDEDLDEFDSEEQCLKRYGGAEYQQLISSLIHFDNDSHAITAASAARLDRIADFYQQTDLFARVVLSGHTDDNASESYNIGLSQRRVLSTDEYLRSRGISGEDIESHYFGESLPLVPNTSDENRAINRRVHIELER